MNNKGFSLIELLGCLVLLTVILGIGLYMARETLSTVILTVDKTTEKEIINSAEQYVLENSVKWINNIEEYACVDVSTLVDYGYFDKDELNNYNNMKVKVVRDSKTLVVTRSVLVDICE